MRQGPVVPEIAENQDIASLFRTDGGGVPVECWWRAGARGEPGDEGSWGARGAGGRGELGESPEPGGEGRRGGHAGGWNGLIV